MTRSLDSDLDQGPGIAEANNAAMDWQPAATAPFDRDLELAVINTYGIHALVFPCRRILGSWINAETKEKLNGFRPTHWREWRAQS